MNRLVNKFIFLIAFVWNWLVMGIPFGEAWKSTWEAEEIVWETRND